MTMSHLPVQHWGTRVPMSSFEQTQFEVDQKFYETFPAARDAAYFPQQPFLSHPQTQPSYYSPSRSIEIEPVYIPSNQPYHRHQSSEPTSQCIPQTLHSPVPTRESTFLVYQPSVISPQVDADIEEIVSDGCPESPSYGFRQLNPHMKPPILKFNNCQLGVMRLDRLSDHSPPDSPIHSGQSHPSPSEPSHDSSRQASPPLTEFLLKSPKSPSIGLSSLPSKNTPEKKPPLACLFCRGRKIACGAPLPGSIKKTCNQCRKRGLQCYYPTESRRGMRKKKPVDNNQDVDTDSTTKFKRKKKLNVNS